MLPLTLCLTPVAAQLKPQPTPDPVKGLPVVAPLTPAERDYLHGKRTPHATDPVAQRVLAGGGGLQLSAVLFDHAQAGELWAMGRTYKASFSSSGFTYVPFLGSAAPRNYPVQFVLRAVRIGDQQVAFDTQAEPLRQGQRVTFERGAVREVYDLGVDQIEQTFVVDSTLPGDVTLELEVRSELGEDAARAGLQFHNELGAVHYGEAFVVAGERKVPTPTRFDGRRLHIEVPAAQRTAGALVVDPILRTEAYYGGVSGDSTEPDIAFLAADGVYAMVWQHVFSQSDYDIFAEMRNADGTLMLGSIAAIDVSNLIYARPRVAAVPIAHRFLVVMEKHDNNRIEVWGTTRASQGTFPVFAQTQINSPADLGSAYGPDVGGNVATGGDPTFFVVWSRDYDPADQDVLGRVVGTDGVPRGLTLAIENSAGTIFANAHVAQMGNASGWMVVYNHRASPNDWDIHGAYVRADGTFLRRAPINTSAENDVEPRVSSPTDAGRYLVTWERKAPYEAMGKLTDDWFLTYATVNFTQQFGVPGFWVRPETDGLRFVLLTGGAGISISSYALLGANLIQVEGPQLLAGVPSYPAVTAQRSGGGRRTDYAVAYADVQTAPDRILVSTFLGCAPTGGLTRYPLACSELGIDVGARQFLGEPLAVALSNVGSDVPGILLGGPGPVRTLCGTCRLAVELNGPLAHFVDTRAIAVPVPADPLLLGVRLAVAGYAFGSGPCAGMRLSDTIDIVIR